MWANYSNTKPNVDYCLDLEALVSEVMSQAHVR